jgi:serine protease
MLTMSWKHTAGLKDLRDEIAAVAAVACIALGLWPTPSLAAQGGIFQHPIVDQWRTNRIIVKWRTTGVAAVQMERLEDRAARLSQVNGINVRPVRNLFGRTDVMLLDHIPSHAEMLSILGRLSADPGIEYAEPDEVRFIQDFPATAPNDPHFVAGSDNFGSWVGQWYLLPNSSTTPAAISATTAWPNVPALGTGIVVAVIDSGVIQDHPDLSTNIQLPGYDFVSCDQGNFNSTVTGALGATQGLDLCSAVSATYNFANYSSNVTNPNWHADGGDPGDFIDVAGLSQPVFKQAGCTSSLPSSWHGTKVAGIIGAIANNDMGIVGVAPMATLLSARVAGACRGALVSDLAAAILWAAGQQVTISTGSIAASPAARIINISLGAPNPCTATEQDAINTATSAGVLIVAAAGNEGGAIDSPANCTGVVSVVGLRHTGDKMPTSSLSSETVAATIAAPGGDCVNTRVTDPCLYDIESSSDESETSPSATPGFYTYSLLNQSYLNSGGNPENEADIGTSFAAPMVSGVLALMLSANTHLTAGQLLARLQSGVLPFPTSSPGSSPTPATCAIASTGADSSGNFSEPTTPTECICTTGTCGAGMLNAAAAVTLASAAFVQITPSSTTGLPGQKISLNGSGSTAAAGHTIVSYQWTTVPPISNQIINPNEPIATLVVPTFRSIGVTLTITDETNATTSATVTIESALAPAGKTGGALQPLWLVALGALALWQIRRRRRAALKLLN